MHLSEIWHSKKNDCRLSRTQVNIYMQNYRLEKAYGMLINDKGLNVSEIAYRCGFTDPKYFSRCFKKAEGCTPTEFRERHQLTE